MLALIFTAGVHALPQTITYAALLRESGLDRIDAQVLFQHATGLSRAWLIAYGGDAARPEHVAAFAGLVARRLQGEPVAYITGTREFFGRDFRVSPGVLIPRPETELLVELALARAGHQARVLDLGCGSGCIPVTLKLERPGLQLTAVDISGAALAVAQENARLLGAEIRFIESDWFSALGEEVFDLIVSNPPYIEQNDPHLGQGDLRFEPRHALTDGSDGLEHVRTIVASARLHLVPGGWLLFEHGWDQAGACRELLETSGYAEVQSWRDLAGHERVSGGRLAHASSKAR